MRAQFANAPSRLPVISRSQFLAGLFILASVNGLAPFIFRDVAAVGWADAVFETFGISVIVWGAWACACYFSVIAEDTTKANVLDMVMGCVVLGLVVLPEIRCSWLAVFVLSTYVYWTSPARSLQRRAALIFFALCVPMLWGPAMIALAGPVLLKVDAILVAVIVGTNSQGNVLTFMDGVHAMQIWPECSSFYNISQAALAWVALGSILDREAQSRDLLWCGLAVISAAAVNLGRLSLMAISTESFQAVHSTVGFQISGALTLILIVIVCMVGQRRELFSRA